MALVHDAAQMPGLFMTQPLESDKNCDAGRFVVDTVTLEMFGIEYPKVPILALGEILVGQRFKTPTAAGVQTPQPRLPGISAVGGLAWMNDLPMSFKPSCTSLRESS